mmetsp:Transcript_111418/g.249037  ORF Transcript_111418/g.249037 Transcript_111418/m.249037 type:complete len:191 (+) Transcript_111418:69-641(+)
MENFFARTFTKTSKEVKGAAATGAACIILFAAIGAFRFINKSEFPMENAEDEEGIFKWNEEQEDIMAIVALPVLGYAFCLFVYLRIRDDADGESDVDPTELMKSRGQTYLKAWGPFEIFIWITTYFFEAVALVWLLRLPSLWRMYQGKIHTVPLADPAASPPTSAMPVTIGVSEDPAAAAALAAGAAAAA